MAQLNATNRFATRSGKTAPAKTAPPEAAMPEVAPPEAAMPEAAPPEAAEVAAALFQQRMAATIKACGGFTQKAKPQRKMLRRIASMGVHPGMGLGIKRWHLYRVGMTMQQAKTTPGLCYLDLTFWEKNKLIVMCDCTDQEYEAEVAAWEAGKPKVEVAA